ncbi:MAG: patatin-like phospholipase family protein [Planctomycetota bacterium]
MTAAHARKSRKIDVPPQVARPADLVLKGGVASGIVYPDAVRKLATKFHFVGIAGTSAGAIVASIAAAAEYRRRQTGSSEGYDVLATASEELMGEGRMLELFRPDAATERAFAPAKGMLVGHSRLRLALRWLVLPLFAPALVVLAISRFASLASVGFLGWLTLALIAVSLGALVLSVLSNARRWRDNDYGFCSGTAQGQTRSNGALPPLSEWLHEKIQSAAGLPLSQPLTFGDLHGAPLPDCLAHMEGRDGFRSIDFRAITTCLSLARPFEFPMSSNLFGFRPEELERVLPDIVVQHLVDAAHARTARERAVRDDPDWTSSRECHVEGTLALPHTSELPVLLATRMSLSFPGLLSMVRLWKYLPGHEPYGPSRTGSHMEPLWFSDGGITSNLPVARFDSPLSAWPTLAINLLYERESDRPVRGADRGKDKTIHLPRIGQDELPKLLYPWRDSGALWPSLGGWVMGIFTSAQVWTDNNAVQMRGSRERVLEVWLSKDEGGLNLNMEPHVLASLLQRGYEAAERLIDRFADEPIEADDAPVEEDSWDQYRWVRIRASVSALSDTIRDFVERFERDAPGDRPWKCYFEIPPEAHQSYRPRSVKQANAMLDDLQVLSKLARKWDLVPLAPDASKDRSRFKTSPKPRAALRAEGPLDA